jgi:hypothetical protein
MDEVSGRARGRAISGRKNPKGGNEGKSGGKCCPEISKFEDREMRKEEMTKK